MIPAAETSLRSSGVEGDSSRGARSRSREASEAAVRQLLEQGEIDTTRMNPRISERLVLLDQLSPFVDDERRCLELAQQVFAFEERERGLRGA